MGSESFGTESRVRRRPRPCLLPLPPLLLPSTFTYEVLPLFSALLAGLFRAARGTLSGVHVRSTGDVQSQPLFFLKLLPYLIPPRKK